MRQPVYHINLIRGLVYLLCVCQGVPTFPSSASQKLQAQSVTVESSLPLLDFGPGAAGSGVLKMKPTWGGVRGEEVQKTNSLPHQNPPKNHQI